MGGWKEMGGTRGAGSAGRVGEGSEGWGARRRGQWEERGVQGCVVEGGGRGEEGGVGGARVHGGGGWGRGGGR